MAGGGNAIRGAGSAPARWARRSAARPRRASGLLLVRQRARDAPELRRATPRVPDVGLPALRLPGRPRPGRTRRRRRKTEPYKTHLAYVKERRSDDDGEAILAEALAARARLRGAPHSLIMVARRSTSPHATPCRP